MSYIALVDCNNFFVSCERVFNPRLRNIPVVILSNNDGCIIARSPEAKALGIPMGGAFFEWKEVIERHQIQIFSSNFSLYGDISHRVMQTLNLLNPAMEIYSIDEAFLFFEGIRDPLEFCHKIRTTVMQWTGIPISIGVAPTKTLAKVANKDAKKNPSLNGVSLLIDPQEIDKRLQTLPVKEIWGIGRRLAVRLAKEGIYSAHELKEKEDPYIRSLLSVVGLRTAWELRGISCISLEQQPPPKKSIMTSRSFGHLIENREALEEAISAFTARGAEKLREEKRLASWLEVFIMTSFHREETYYSNYVHVSLVEPTSFTPSLINAAKRGLNAIFRPGLFYKKAGVLLGGLVGPPYIQSSFFAVPNGEQRKKEHTLMGVLDEAQKRFDYTILQFASEGIQQNWRAKREKISSHFTTQWEEILAIKI